MKFNIADKIVLSNREFTNDVVGTLSSAWKQYNETSATKTMRELLTPAIGELTLGKSTNGYAQLTLGAGLPGPVVYCDSDSIINCLNAIADWPVYRVNELYNQEKYFNPDLNNAVVKIMWDMAQGQFHFWNWKKGYVDCFMNYEIKKDAKLEEADEPDEQYNDKVSWRLNTIRKHRSINQILACKGVQPFGVVMFAEEQLAHFQTRIGDFLDKPYAEYRKFRGEATAAYKLNKNIKNGTGVSFNSTREISDKRMSILNEISTRPVPFTVSVKEPCFKNPFLYPVLNEVDRVNTIAGLTTAPEEFVVEVA